MAWLEATLRTFLGATTPPNKVLEVKPERYANRTIICRGDGIVLYGNGGDGQGNKFEIVLHRPYTETSRQAYSFSLLRSETQAEAETFFAVYKDKLPVIVEISRELCNVGGIQKLCDILNEHPSWTLAHLAAQLSLYNAFNYSAVNSRLNSCDPTTGVSPLQIAVRTNNLKMVRMLVDAKSCPAHADLQGNTVYHYAATSSKEIILSLGAGLPTSLNGRNADGHTPIHVACLADKPECVKALILLGADVNVSANEARSPSSPGYVGEFLQDKPNALHPQDMKFGGTPLHWSCSREVINALIEKNCDVDALNFDGRTALHVMVLKKRLDCVVALLARAANVEVADNEGNTPLHLAAINPSVPIVQALLAFGAPTDYLNRRGESPRHLIPLEIGGIRTGGGGGGGNVDDAEAKRVLYAMHAVGAPRCPAEQRGCGIGCAHAENYYGEVLSETIIPTKTPRNVIDQMLYVAGMDKFADRREGRTRGKGEEGKTDDTGGRLLCLDGGGIRGLVLVQILLEIETIVGSPIIDRFDWIAGTSTGGILALALASGKSLKECQALYFRMKDEAFVGARPYTSEGLENVLKDALGEDTTMSDIEKPKLMITGVLADRKPVDLHLFRNYESPGNLLGVPPCNKFKPTFSPDRQLLWRAARATGAAPSYFRAFGRFLDGGLIANNPTLDALTEIHEYNLALRAVGRGDEARGVTLVVSAGTGLIPLTPLKDIDVFRPESLWDTAKLAMGISALGTLLVDQATASDGRVVDRARTWCSMIGVPYYRFNPRMSEEVAMDERNDETLVNMIWEAKAFMHANRDQIKELAVVLDSSDSS